ncbi:MAG: GGDEF domain-containing protein [Sulfurimonas sp.]|nr:GGDEF domain-containing protein [Sulfurimonas sp.]
MSTEINTYNKSKLTLRYKNKNLEKNYLSSIFDAKKSQMLFIIGLTFFIYILYVILDFLILTPQELPMAVSFHLSVIALWIYLISSIYYNIFRRIAINILYLMPIYAVLGTLLFAYYHNPIYIIDIYVILFWSFVTIGYMFLESVIVSSIIAILSAVFLYIFNIIDFKHYLLHIFVLISAWTLGLLASYIVELYSRKNFENQLEIIDMQTELKEQANRDYLTNLYNRRYFNEVAQDFIKVAKRANKTMSLIIIDIDNFKNINDKYGHSAGDYVLKQLASLLEDNTRDSDIVARFGGEEFVILLPYTNKVGAFKIAEELRISIANQDFKINNNDNYIKVTISLGIDSMDNYEDTEISDVLNRADRALYQAKENGKNQTIVYQEI